MTAMLRLEQLGCSHVLGIPSRPSTSKPRIRPLPEAVLQKIDTYINDPLTVTIHLDDLVAIAGLSRCHFIRAFKAATTLTPMAYVERKRVERARLLVTDGEMKLAEIAHFVGFADQSHFTRRFKAIVGCTPGYYAKYLSDRRSIVHFT